MTWKRKSDDAWLYLAADITDDVAYAADGTLPDDSGPAGARCEVHSSGITFCIEVSGGGARFPTVPRGAPPTRRFHG